MGDCRRIGLAVDFSPCSRKALKWAVENLVRKGDHLILITVRPEGYYETGEMQLWETTGSPLVPLIEFSDPHVMKKYEVSPDPETLDIVSTVSRQKEDEKVGRADAADGHVGTLLHAGAEPREEPGDHGPPQV